MIKNAWCRRIGYNLLIFNKISNHLQQDVVKIAGKTIFINPFLYWRRFDENTNRWLREPGQMSEEQIQPNRNRFYPEIDWADLSRPLFEETA